MYLARLVKNVCANLFNVYKSGKIGHFIRQERKVFSGSSSLSSASASILTQST